MADMASARPSEPADTGIIYAHSYEVVRQFLKDRDFEKLTERFHEVERDCVEQNGNSDLLKEALSIWNSDACIYLQDYERAWLLRTALRRGSFEIWTAKRERLPALVGRRECIADSRCRR